LTHEALDEMEAAERAEQAQKEKEAREAEELSRRQALLVERQVRLPLSSSLGGAQQRERSEWDRWCAKRVACQSCLARATARRERRKGGESGGKRVWRQGATEQHRTREEEWREGGGRTQPE